MTIRTKLAAAFTVLVAAILMGVGVVTYQLLRQSLLAEIERDVARRAASFAAAETSNLDVFGAPDVFLQVTDSAGVAVARSGNLGERTLPLPDAAREGHVVEVRVAGRPLFLTAAPLNDGRHIIVARSPVTTYQALRTLRNLLATIITAAVVVTAMASWLYARTALRPIGRIAAAAKAIRDSRDLSQRVPHRGPPDEVGQLVATFNDMLTELEGLYETLERSNQQLRQFLADCSHELRTPLTRIRSTIDILQRTDATGVGDETFRYQALADITAETERMARMVRQLLILARADAGASIEPRPTNLGQVLDTVCRQAERMTGELTFTPPRDGALAGAVVDGDADHLIQVVLILLDNAFKYTPPPGEVRLEAHHDTATAYITVADTGLGIAPEDTQRIFERFYRGRNGSAATGTGLGLAIATWAIHQHHGHIELATSANGSRFTITLPLATHTAGA